MGHGALTSEVPWAGAWLFLNEYRQKTSTQASAAGRHDKAVRTELSQGERPVGGTPSPEGPGASPGAAQTPVAICHPPVPGRGQPLGLRAARPLRLSCCSLDRGGGCQPCRRAVTLTS